ncbi:metallophosphoesterase [Yoonia sp. I 8.24]|uniref:metallophosphoesterase n=1 Tax=Yoonia sp. I 8.24 TaxID=1537229 RepID=UPI001EDF22D8|nr:metallophosphoesterase [Yoonia sp. I 8.24]MCG3266518.1 metallophosphoesterase [Yoonia sp. I 8.24]
MLKFVVLADIHLVPENQLSHGLDTLDRLEQAVAYVNDVHADADFVIFAGDLADHGEPAAYERFKTAIAPLTPNVHLTLGNHDHRPTFLDVMGADQAHPETGCIDHVIDAGGHRVIVLDTSDPELRGAGRLEASQIDWLKARLDEAPDTPVVIVLHHNITTFNVQTDYIILEDNAVFADAVLSHAHVRQVISGHVHMTTAGNFKGVPFCTFAGAHYNIEPMATARSGPVPEECAGYVSPVPRREGPGQLAVVLCNDESVVVHMENFLDRHLTLAPDLFAWS